MYVRYATKNMTKKGERVYVPPVVIEELENIMSEHDLTIKAEGFRKMVKYARVGRKVEARINTQPVLDLNKISAEIPIGAPVRHKKRDMTHILGL